MKKKKKLEKKVFLPKCKNELLMFNRENILKNARNKYHSKGGKKDCQYYVANTEVLREDARNKCRNLSEEEKEKKRKYPWDRYHLNIDLNETLKGI